jgi:hypothetical protein
VTEAAREPLPLRSAALHLLVLSTFAIAQPLFDQLGPSPAFFAAHEIGRWGMIAFALVVLLVPPLVLVAIEGLARLALPDRVAEALHLFFVGALFALFALGIVRRAGWAPLPTFLLSALVGVAAAAVYRRFVGVRSALSVLAFAPVLFTFLFLFTSNSASLVTSGDTQVWDAKSTFRPPIVLVTFDAFPSEMLNDGAGKIDARRFPNFARLAGTATWYPNATNVHENTSFSIPSILDGQVPDPSDDPTVQGHPNNLFTLLGHTYDIRSSEEVTNLCPPGVCERPNEGSAGDKISLLADDVFVVYQYLVAPKNLRESLPSIDDRWRNFRDDQASSGDGVNPDKGKVLAALADGGRPERFRTAVDAIAPGSQPTLDFIHPLLPHEPLEYLPSGQRYQAGEERDPSLDGPESYDNAFLTDQGYQRHLLQAGFADGLLGQLIDRLRAQGMWDDALVVITADHGVSFRVKPGPAPPFVPGRLGYRRELTPENAQDVGMVPLFVKYPGQKAGKEDPAWGRTIDILPTIADVLGIELPFKVDGTSLRAPRPVPTELSFRRTKGETITVEVAALQRQRKAALARQVSLLGTTWADAYEIGPRPELIGRAVSSLRALPAGSVRAEVAASDRFDDVDPNASFSPTHVTGSLTGGDPAGLELAFAVNGRIVSTGVSFDDVGPSGRNFSSLLPPAALRAGANELAVYALRAEGGSFGLVPLGTAGGG